MASVRLDKVRKVFDGGVTAVHEMTLEIPDKEFVVLVGPSGCGKSTALRMIAGLEEVTSGDIFIDGERVNEVAPKDRDIAMVFQNYALYPHMTVYENLAFGLKLRHFRKSEIIRRVNEAAAVLQIEELLKRKPKALSGGQRQRVAVGRAIVRKPKVFLFDEPLSNLDAKLRVQMRTEISRLHRRLETTMIYVTHDQIEAMTMGTKIVLMKDGYVQQIDSPLGIYDCPANKFVAGFVGSPAMNFFDGTLERGETLTFVETGGGVKLPLVGEDAVALEHLTGKEITLGLRPEHLSYDSRQTARGVVCRVNIELVEPLGNEMFVHFSTGAKGTHYIARGAMNENIKVGDSLDLVFDTSKVHLFEAGSGRKLGRDRTG